MVCDEIAKRHFIRVNVSSYGPSDTYTHFEDSIILFFVQIDLNINFFLYFYGIFFINQTHKIVFSQANCVAELTDCFVIHRSIACVDRTSPSKEAGNDLRL